MNFRSIDETFRPPQGKFALILWDAYLPRTKPPIWCVELYDDIEQARAVCRALEPTAQPEGQLTPDEIVAYTLDASSRLIEPEYFIMDEQGMRA